MPKAFRPPLAGLEDITHETDVPPWALLRPGHVVEFTATRYLDYPAAARLAAVLSQAATVRARSFVWIQSKAVSREWGRPYALADTQAVHAAPPLLIECEGEKAQLWCVEEILAAWPAATVIALLPPREGVYDFTCSRRLALRARKGGLALLIRGHGTGGTTAAHVRFSVAAMSSTAAPFRSRGLSGLGDPRWHVRLERARGLTPRDWLVQWDEAHSLPVVTAPGYGPAVAPAASERRRASA